MIEFSDDKLARIAFHEAGHAWMMVKEGLGVKSMSLKPGGLIQGDNRGETLPEQQLEEGRKDLSEKHAKAALAGTAAEYFLLGNWDNESLQASAFDRGRARSCLVMSGDDWNQDSLEYYLQTMSCSIMEEISQPRIWHTITALAYELLEAGTLTGEDVSRVLMEK